MVIGVFSWLGSGWFPGLFYFTFSQQYSLTVKLKTRGNHNVEVAVLLTNKDLNYKKISMDRKEFIKRTMAATAILPIAGAMVACGDDSEPTPTNTGGGSGSGGSGGGSGGGGTSANCLENGTNVSIGSNHGHSLTVSKEDVAAGTAKTYSIMGSSGHNHSVTIPESDFATLQSNLSITVESTTGDSHTHSVTVTCA